MKRPRPTETELDRLLARGYHDTSAEFEARWVALKRDLRRRPPITPFPARANTVWFAVLGAAVAAVVLFFSRPSMPPVAEPSPSLHELLSLDAALAPARPLLDEETRFALLHLAPAETTPEVSPP